jgi:glutaredoxin
MVNVKHVKGQNKGKIMLYALSTCLWCKKTKNLLENLGVAYTYVYVDLLEEKEKDKTMETIRKWNPRCSFPTLVINEKESIVGFKEDRIKEALGI